MGVATDTPPSEDTCLSVISSLHQCPSRLSAMSAAVSSMTLLLVLVILVTILEAAPLAQGDNDTKFLEVVEQIRKVSASLSTIDAAKVDVYEHLVASVPEKSRLKVSRRILRKLLHIRDRTMRLSSNKDGWKRLT